MWAIIQFLFYDLPYFLYKTAEDFKWSGLIVFVVYQIGRVSGMRVFRKYLEAHFPYFRDEAEDFKKWTIREIIKLGGEPFIPQREYHGATRLKKSAPKSYDSSLTKSPEDINQEVNMKTVVIDAGHGGKDNGATGTKREKDFNLSVALKIESLFVNHPSVQAKLTRSTDVFIELTDRAKIANDLKADVFLSVHANSSSTTSQGSETLHTKDMDKPFATIVHKYLIAATGLVDRKVKVQNLSVCRNTRMPAALIEPGFVSNPNEEGLLFDETFQTKLAKAMAEAICEYLGVLLNESKPPVVNGTSPLTVITPTTPLQGFLKDGVSWIPARPILDSIGATWGLNGKSITINQSVVETMIVDGKSYIKAKDIMLTGAGRIFFDNATSPKVIEIYPPLGGTQ